MKKKVKKIIRKALKELQKKENWGVFELPEIMVEYPKNEKFGDYATNIAMVLAGKIGKNPMEVSGQIKKEILKQVQNDDAFEKIKIMEPGYINFYLAKKYLQNLVSEIITRKEKFGDSGINREVKVNNEFISANPTGPLHLGNGRGGFYGDVISRTLKKTGAEMVNEYYINDAGEQIIKLGHSVLKDNQAEYQGEYIDKLNKKIKDETDLKKVGKKSAEYILENIIKKTISDKMKINFDSWISEKRDIGEKGKIDEAIKVLKEKKLTYKKKGALWLKTTKFGDDKDRVLIKKDGVKTYFASDCGYILNKIERGFNKIIEIWGADHHGYILRFQAVAQALEFKGELKFIVVQLVRLIKDGKEARMSKRAQNVVYIDDLIDEVGHDVTRFFFLMYSPDTHMVFDLDLAKERSEKNPVYYIQYAHARICSILRKTRENLRDSASLNQNGRKTLSFKLLTHEKELSLIRELNKFPELMEEISESYEVHRLPQYAIGLADKFHSFYATCRVIDEANLELSKSRLNLINAVKIVLAETLRLIGINAPKKM